MWFCTSPCLTSPSRYPNWDTNINQLQLGYIVLQHDHCCSYSDEIGKFKWVTNISGYLKEKQVEIAHVEWVTWGMLKSSDKWHHCVNTFLQLFKEWE